MQLKQRPYTKTTISMVTAVALTIMLHIGVSTQTAPARAQTGPTINLIPAALGQTRVTVAITGTNLPDTGGFEFDFISDPAIVQPVTATLGDFLDSTGGTVGVLGPQSDPISGTLAMGGYVFNMATAPSGAGELATIGMDVVGEGISRLTLTDTIFASPAATAYDVMITDGALQAQHLQLGWQMVGVCVDASAQGVKTALSSVDGRYQRVLGAEGSYVVGLPENFNTLHALAPGKNYWIYASQAGNLNLLGDWWPPDTTQALAAGWNWIGYCNAQPLPVTQALASIEDKYTRVIGDDGSFVTSLPPSFNTLKTMEPGKGYLIYMTEPATLTYPSPAAAQQALLPQPFSDVALCPDLARTPWFSEIYGQVAPAAAGQVLRAVAGDGRVVGCARVRADGSYGLMRLYGGEDGLSGLRFQLDEAALPAPPAFRWSPEHELIRLDFDDIPLPGSGGHRVWLPLVGR